MTKYKRKYLGIHGILQGENALCKVLKGDWEFAKYFEGQEEMITMQE